MSGRIGYSVIGAGLIGGMAAVAMTLGLGGVDAGTPDQLVRLTADAESLGSSDLLVLAATNFLDAKDVFTGIDTTDLSETFLSAVERVQGLSDVLDRTVSVLDNYLSPAEAAILLQSGSMSELVDQLFLTPLNQQWANAAESLLSAAQAFDSAVSDGSVPDTVAAGLEIIGVDFFQVIPAALMSVPVVLIGSLFDESLATGLFDYSL